MYKLTNLKVFKETVTKTQKKNKYNRATQVNALLKYYNNKVYIQKKEDKQVYNYQVTCNARL